MIFGKDNERERERADLLVRAQEILDIQLKNLLCIPKTQTRM